MPYQYDFALSFAGEDRAVVEEVRAALRMYGLSVFYDMDEQHDLLGKDLAEHFSRLYSSEARFCVLFVSKAYSQKPWCAWERRAALARAFRSQLEYVIPYFLDDTRLPAIPETIGRADLRTTPPREFGTLLARKFFRDSATPPVPLLMQDALHNLASRDVFSSRPVKGKGVYVTSFYKLDRKLRGPFREGSLYLVGARPAMGKTMFALNIAERNARQGRAVIYVSFEESVAQLTMRLAAMRARASIYAIRRDLLSKPQMNRLAKASTSLANEPLLLLEEQWGAGLDSVLCKLWSITSGRKCMIVIDCLHQIGREDLFGLMPSIGVHKALRAIQWLAAKSGCVIVVCAQLSRSPEHRDDHTPQISDFRGGKSLVVSAEAAFLLHRESYYAVEHERQAQQQLSIYIVRRGRRRMGPVNLDCDVTQQRIADERIRVSDEGEDDAIMDIAPF